MRADPGLTSLRSPRVFPALRRALAACNRISFRLIQFSVQSNHLHLIVEADDNRALTRGLQGLAVRCARAINRRAGRRGRVWAHRYHARSMATPTEVRRALVYVLMNVRKHDRAHRPGIDPCSSAPWFDGFIAGRAPAASRDPPPVSTPCTWLASRGWRLRGLIDPREYPRPLENQPTTLLP